MSNDNSNGDSSNGRTSLFESEDLGSIPSSPSKFNRKEYMREYQKEWYKRNSEKVKKQTDKYKYELKEWFAKEIVAKASCIKCGENHPGCLDFHHRDPLSKDNNVADMITTKRTKVAILKEIEKCDILCANCHRKLHYEERNS